MGSELFWRLLGDFRIGLNYGEWTNQCIWGIFRFAKDFKLA